MNPTRYYPSSSYDTRRQSGAPSVPGSNLLKERRPERTPRAESGRFHSRFREAIINTCFILYMFSIAIIYAILEYYHPPEWVWNVVLGPLGLVAVLLIFRISDEWYRKQHGCCRAQADELHQI